MKTTSTTLHFSGFLTGTFRLAHGVTLLWLASMCPIPATAQDSPPDLFTRLDTNKDGYLTKMEAEPAGMAKNFTTADRNGDGRLDSNEFAAAQQKSTSSAETSMSKSQSVTKSTPSDEEDDQYFDRRGMKKLHRYWQCLPGGGGRAIRRPSRP